MLFTKRWKSAGGGWLGRSRAPFWTGPVESPKSGRRVSIWEWGGMAREGGEKESFWEPLPSHCSREQLVGILTVSGGLGNMFKLFFGKNDKIYFPLKPYDRNVPSAKGKFDKRERKRKALHFKITDSTARKDTYCSLWWRGQDVASSLLRGTKCEQGDPGLLSSHQSFPTWTLASMVLFWEGNNLSKENFYENKLVFRKGSENRKAYFH